MQMNGTSEDLPYYGSLMHDLATTRTARRFYPAATATTHLPSNPVTRRWAHFLRPLTA